MTARLIVIQPAPALTVEEVADQVEEALARRGSLTRVLAVTGIGVDALAQDPAAALTQAASRVTSADTDSVLIDQATGVPLTTFDDIGWDLDLAATAGARVLLALDVEGVPAALVAQDIRVAQARAAAHGTTISAALLPAALRPLIDSEAAGGVALVGVPLTEEDIDALIG